MSTHPFEATSKAPVTVTCILRAGGPETFREGEAPSEPSACAGSDGASPSQDRRRSSNREKYKSRNEGTLVVCAVVVA